MRRLLLVLLLFGCGTAVDLGDSSQAIVNGELDSGHPEVGLVALGNGYCSGTLIGFHSVLTAAHCVVGDSGLRFYLAGAWRTIQSTSAHPGFSGEVGESDVALLALSQDVPGVRPAIVATAAPQLREPLDIVGYGQIAQVDSAEPAKRFTANTIGGVAEQYFVYFHFSGTSGGTCHGDSGGPSFVTRNGREELVGIHSGSTCEKIVDGRDESHGVDTRADIFHDFIAGAAAGDLYDGRSIEPPAAAIRVAPAASVEKSPPLAATDNIPRGDGVSGCQAITGNGDGVAILLGIWLLLRQRRATEVETTGS